MKYPLIVGCFGCIFLFSPSLLLGLFADDLLWLSLYNGERFAHGEHTFEAFFFDAFSFFKGDAQELLALKAQALVPWWVDDALKIQFFRPVSAVTHWLDFTLFKNQVHWMHLHSIAWFCALLWVVQRWYWAFLNDCIVVHSSFSMDSRKILVLSLLIFSLDFSHLFPIYWLSNRNIIVASFFVFLSLWYFHRAIFHKENVPVNKFYFLSLVFYFISVFSSENAFFLVLFFPVYAYFSGKISMASDSGDSGVSIVRISIVYATVFLVSFMLYSKLGYGVFATDLYIHPIENIKLYLLSAIEKIPLYWFSSLLGLDGFYMGLPPLGRVIAWIVSVFTTLGFLVCMRKWVFCHRSILLLFILINIALIPPIGFALFDTRTLFLASVPFSLFLSCLFFYGYQKIALKSIKLRKFFVGTFLFFHIIFATICWFFSGYFISQFSHALIPISLRYEFLNQNLHDSVFIFNHPDPLSHLYSSLAFPEHSHHLPFLLGTAFQKMKLMPISDYSAPCQIKIEFSPEFFHAEHKSYWLPFSHFFEKIQSFKGMHWRQHHFGARSASIFAVEQWKEGEKIEFPTFYIQIQKMRLQSVYSGRLDEDKIINETNGIHEIIFAARSNKACHEYLFYYWDTHLELYNQIFPVENGKEYWLE